ncbi:long-chain-fatty-acid--CoA ligase [Citricoccus sp. NR2]|uniref:long-chain-fatty-acid--CoA ligase n=1 Tax=Citricoccus sp. NR2 TaxID=3004095 RepID=UPI0022DE60BF|nr:long-chain-fatty-acid--CoA ligase [Citricoccus sp. NR2]WBL20437.1 long-chain-fatty-acid--CoA ligase [Citricoccus sp. NR2]
MTSPVLGTVSTMGDAQLTTTRMLAHAARSFGDQDVVHRTLDGQWHTTNYADTWARVRRLATGLSGLGIGAGTHVGLLMWNDLRHFESYFAVPALAATMVQLNLRLSPTDLSYVIEHSGVSHIIVDESLRSVMEDVQDRVSVTWIIASDDVDDARDGELHYEALLASEDEAERFQLPEVDERTASGACFTTGTTGRPKGVFFSHRSTWLHASAVAMNIGITVQDTIMFLTPMFHVQCWGLPYTAVLVGARSVLPGRFAATEMEMLTSAMMDHGITVAPAAPAILMPMLQHLEGVAKNGSAPDFSRMRLICGASEPPLSMMRGFYELTGAEVVHAYGATETSPVASTNRLRPGLGLTEDEAWELRRSQGYVVPGVDVKIVDPAGEPLPHDGKSVGEIMLRGPWITAEYYQNPEASEAGFDAEGYWRSGDVGFIDSRGYLKVTDRLKDVIKSGGEWISSIDMENLIVSLPGVAEAAVFGIPHPTWEERPLALVVTQEGDSVSDDDVRGVLRGAFADWQLPDEVLFVDTIARTSVGKLNKKGLREQYRDQYQS